MSGAQRNLTHHAITRQPESRTALGITCTLIVQGREKRYACFAKQQPGRARQNFLATTGTNLISRLCILARKTIYPLEFPPPKKDEKKLKKLFLKESTIPTMRDSTPGSSPETSSSILVVAVVVVAVVVVVVAVVAEVVVLSLVVVLAGQIGLPMLTHVCVVMNSGFGRFVVDENFSLRLSLYLFIFFLLFLSMMPLVAFFL